MIQAALVLTAGSFGDQEGVALWLEESAGAMDGHRLRTLAARVLATDGMHRGASFGEIARLLHLDHGFRPAHAIAIAERAYRGGGVARDVGYLAGWLRVRSAILARDVTLDELRSGRVGLSMFHLLNTFCLIGFLALAVDAVRDPRPVARGSSPTRWALIAGALALLALGATGAVASLGDQIFPAPSLAAGLRDDLNPASHFLVRLRGIHPFVAVSGALYVASSILMLRLSREVESGR